MQQLPQFVSQCIQFYGQGVQLSRSQSRYFRYLCRKQAKASNPALHCLYGCTEPVGGFLSKRRTIGLVTYEECRHSSLPDCRFIGRLSSHGTLYQVSSFEDMVAWVSQQNLQTASIPQTEAASSNPQAVKKEASLQVPSAEKVKKLSARDLLWACAALRLARLYGEDPGQLQGPELLKHLVDQGHEDAPLKYSALVSQLSLWGLTEAKIKRAFPIEFSKLV